jgi:hypothetical protein
VSALLAAGVSSAERSTRMIALIVVAIIIVVLVGAGVSLFNSLVRRRNRTKEAWS